MVLETIKEKGYEYIEVGEGPVIVLLHGLMGGLNNFENVIGIFAKGDLPNLANFIQQHRDEEVEEKAESKTG